MKTIIGAWQLWREYLRQHHVIWDDVAITLLIFALLFGVPIWSLYLRQMPPAQASPINQPAPTPAPRWQLRDDGLMILKRPGPTH